MSRAGCSHHLRESCTPGLRSAARYNTMIRKFAIYFVTVFCWWAIYTPILSSPTVTSAAPMGGYTYVLSHWCSCPMLVIRWTAQWWKLARDVSSRGFTTHVSDPKKSLFVPTPHKIYLASSYPPPLSPKSSPFVPTFPTPATYSAPLPDNHCQRMIKYVPSTWIKVLPSAASPTPRKPSPSVPPSSQQPTSAASSLTCADTYLRLGAPDLVPPVGQTCHTGDTGGDLQV